MKERERINEILSLKEILRDAKQCPSCKLAISQTEGCNKMVCYNCGTYFCYGCNQAIAGYDHFRNGGCDLFPQEMIQDWAQPKAEICPRCAQLNPKEGENNHLFCRACQTHYCYLCQKVVKCIFQHFGRKGCKQ